MRGNDLCCWLNHEDYTSAMKAVSVASCRHGEYAVIATAMERLTEVPPESGAVICLGLRLEDFPAEAWAGLYEFLRSPAGSVWLSDEELERARRFLHCADGVRHLLGRNLLRRALGRWSGRALPAAWPLNAWGKPEPWADMHFSISHAGGDVWLAVSRAGAVGIDVEDAIPAAEDLLTWLHPAETACNRDLADPGGLRRLWVRKEAVVKAVGMGLSLPLNAFRVAADAHATDWLLQAPAAFPPPWSAFDIPVSGEVAAAVAVRGGGVSLSWRLRCVRWES